MAHILIVITVFTTGQGLASDTRFQEFSTAAACESARASVERGVRALKGQMGREIFAGCYAKGDPRPAPDG